MVEIFLSWITGRADHVGGLVSGEIKSYSIVMAFGNAVGFALCAMALWGMFKLWQGKMCMALLKEVDDDSPIIVIPTVIGGIVALGVTIFALGCLCDGFEAVGDYFAPTRAAILFVTQGK